MRRVVGAGAAAIVAGLVLASCHLPTYGGLTDRWEIGCQQRGGTSIERPGPPGWRTCLHQVWPVTQCHQILEMDPRFSSYHREHVCRVVDFQPGTMGYIDPNYGH